MSLTPSLEELFNTSLYCILESFNTSLYCILLEIFQNLVAAALYPQKF